MPGTIDRSRMMEMYPQMVRVRLFMVGMSRKGPCAMSKMKPLKVAVSNRFLAKQGFLGLVGQYQALGKAI